ncbi:hypothetical protein ACHAW6_010422 [Cyclotella cf. meneghiniana]
MSQLHQAGIHPHKPILDNEIFTAMKRLITDKYKMTYKLVPSGCHRFNAAKVAIKNFKAYFLAFWWVWQQISHCLYGTNSSSNLLCQSDAMPTVSAYAHLNGPFDYNKCHFPHGLYSANT